MKIRKKLLLQIMGEYAMTAAELARAMAVDATEIERLLAGGAVGEATARNFIGYFGAAEAQRLIDWEAIGKKNPLCPVGRAGAAARAVRKR